MPPAMFENRKSPMTNCKSQISTRVLRQKVKQSQYLSANGLLSLTRCLACARIQRLTAVSVVSEDSPLVTVGPWPTKKMSRPRRPKGPEPRLQRLWRRAAGQAHKPSPKPIRHRRRPRAVVGHPRFLPSLHLPPPQSRPHLRVRAVGLRARPPSRRGVLCPSRLQPPKLPSSLTRGQVRCGMNFRKDSRARSARR